MSIILKQHASLNLASVFLISTVLLSSCQEKIVEINRFSVGIGTLNPAIKTINSGTGSVTVNGGGGTLTIDNTPDCGSLICSYCCLISTSKCTNEETCTKTKASNPSDIHISGPRDVATTLPYIILATVIFTVLLILLIVFCHFHKKASSCGEACRMMWCRCCKNTDPEG